MGALDGLRIVEMDAIGPVPLAGGLLADMGADIIRIARVGGQAAYDDLGEAILHRGRPGIELDLKTDGGRETALELISTADALIEGFRPGVMERLGLGPDVCLARNPGLVYARMTGWGQTGPRAARAGHDINYIAIAGALGLMGAPDRPPEPPLNLVGDYGGGALFLALGVMAGVHAAQRTGRGQTVDVAMTDGTARLLSLFVSLSQTGAWTSERGANLLDGGAPFYRCYACADCRHVAVGALEPQFFASLLAGLGLPDRAFVQYDRACWPAMRDRFEEIFAGRTRDDWNGIFAQTDACVTPVLSLEEAMADAHNRARATYAPFEGLAQPGPAPRFEITKSSLRPASIIDAETALARWKGPA
ncbi:CaiB/BaiF CoA-transferase family protein [Sulfitobacter sp. LCG007]